jgi:general secretion pathway protein K
MTTVNHCRKERGSALLAVLWLSAALAVIGFTVSSTVRGETDRTSTVMDGLRSYYLAVAGVERCALEVLWSVNNPQAHILPANAAVVNYSFETGDVRVEILPETGKLDVNHAPVEQLIRLGAALGIDAGRAEEIAEAIKDWRQPGSEGNSLDLFYSSQPSSFRAPHASFREIEELLQVKGVTPDIFYGTYVPAAEGATGPGLMWHGGLADCLTVYGSGQWVDANSAPPAVLAAVGVNPGGISGIVQRRQSGAMTQAQLNQLMGSLGIQAPLRVGGNSIVTIRATAQLRLEGGGLSDLKRTVAAQVKYMPPGYDAPIHILRWYDTAWSN